ncbi:MAG: helix-turn-helix transcriptional regulator [Clostridiales Family XIII bacterium]|nr:helix-turn-helix transcriptional regulator [Clostridiales Family XIII bacterium]
MNTQPDDLRILVQKHVRGAEARYGGMCATVASSTLGKLFDVPLDDTVAVAGTGVRFAGAAGAAQNAFVGAAQFIACEARLNELSGHEILALCRSWQKKYEKYEDAIPQGASKNAWAEDGCAIDVILLAHGFIEENRDALGLGKEPAKPRQYYDSIYTDREAMFRHSPYALEEKLSTAVTKGDGEAALVALREITAQGDKAVLAKDSLRSAKNSMIGSIAFLSRAAIQGGVSANDAFALSDALTRRVEEMAARDAVLAFEENILLQFIALVRQRLEASYSATVVKVMHYVENHLDTKVSLNAAAAYAGVHPAYLSSRFRRETGLSFTEYTAMRKVQESCYFVRHTGYSISQIALLYGFSSQSYYTTIFKNVTGMTPIEYRRRRLAE